MYIYLYVANINKNKINKYNNRIYCIHFFCLCHTGVYKIFDKALN